MRIVLVVSRFGCSVGEWVTTTVQEVAKADVQAIFVEHDGPTPIAREGAVPFHVKPGTKPQSGRTTRTLT